VADSGDQLAQDMRTIEAEEAVKVRRVENDFEVFEKEQRAIIDGARQAFEDATAAELERQNDLIELRTRELQRNKEDTKKEFEAERAKVLQAMTDFSELQISSDEKIKLLSRRCRST